MSKKGFTLIEILIVVAIMSILASIVLVGLAGFRGRGRDARRISDLRQVQNALELYYSKSQYYPDAASWTAVTDALKNAGIGVTTVSNDPLSPQKSYGYCRLNNGQNYVLTADLEDANNPALKDSVKGTYCSYNCQGTLYCVQF